MGELSELMRELLHGRSVKLLHHVHDGICKTCHRDELLNSENVCPACYVKAHWYDADDPGQPELELRD